MRPPTSTVRRAVAIAVAAALLLAGCGDDDATDQPVESAGQVDRPGSDDATDATDPSASAPSTTDAGSADPADVEGPDIDADRVIEITVVGDTVEGGGRQEVAVGDTVALVITADVTDEVHVHGYDLYTDLVPGQPATVTFEATMPGVWEVELHDAGTVLVELQVS